MKDLVIDQRTGVFVPAGTQGQIINKLNAAINAALADPKVRNSFIEQAQLPAGGSVEQYAQVVQQDSNKYARLVKELDISIQ